MTRTDGEAFPAADVDKELHPATNKDFQIDSVSSAVDATKQEEEAAERKEQEMRDALQRLKKGVIVSGILVAVVGALFAITNKIRHKSS